jgi:hypothetical protein
MDTWGRWCASADDLDARRPGRSAGHHRTGVQLPLRPATGTVAISCVVSLALQQLSVNRETLHSSLDLTGLLKLKRVGIDTHNESIAYVDRHCRAFRPDQHRALKKVGITSEDGREILASLAIVDDEGIVADDELGLSEQGFSNLGLPEGSRVAIAPAVPPRSLESVRAKIRGATLSSEDIRNIVVDIAHHR